MVESIFRFHPKQKPPNISHCQNATACVLDLLENPPAPTDRLVRAVKAGQILA